MIYLPDTNAWIVYLNPGDSPVKARFRAHPPTDVAFCSVVKAELFYGAYHSSRREDNLRLLATLFPQFKSMPFDDLAAETYGRLRADLVARGTLIAG